MFSWTLLTLLVRVSNGLTIVVAAANGKVGRHVLAALAGKDSLTIVPLVRSTSRLRAELERLDLSTSLCDAMVRDAIECDYTDTDAVSAAFSKIRPGLISFDELRLFLATGNGPRQAEAECNVLQAARRVGVTYVVKLSTATQVLEMESGPYQAHRQVEAALQQAESLCYTVLRPNIFMQMTAAPLIGIGAALAHTDACVHPFADTPISMVDARDVGAVAATLLSAREPRERNAQILELTGPKAVTYRELAQCLSSVRPRPVSCEPVSLEEHVSAPSLRAFLGTLSRCSATSTTIEECIGRPATPLAEFVLRQAAEFQPAI